MPKIEVIARGACIRDSRVLVCRNKKHGYSYLPGGHVEFGESARAALEREMLEETAAPFHAGDFEFATEVQFEAEGGQHHEVSLVFLMEQASPVADVKSVEPEIAFEWIDLASVIDHDLRPESVKAWLMSGGEGSRWISQMESASD